MIDLGTLGGTFGMANAINDAGEVVGVSNLAGDNNARPFLWKNGHLIDLGSLGGGYSAASSINEQGDVAGSYFTDQQNFDASYGATASSSTCPPSAARPRHLATPSMAWTKSPATKMTPTSTK
jgi:probable HAF family extracellular repeat protein